MLQTQPSLSSQVDLDKLTYINVGAEGKLNGKLHTTAEDIDAILARLQMADVSKVLLHFHGGLVNEEAGELTARRVVPLYQSAGAHPVVFIWETGCDPTRCLEIREFDTRNRSACLRRYPLEHVGHPWAPNAK